MSKSTEYLVYGVAAVAMAMIARYAFADSINQNQSGNGNTQIVGNGNNSPVVGSNNPSASATGGNATSHSVSNSHSSSLSASSSSARQHQAQFQSVSDSSSANNEGNSLSVQQNYKRNPVSSAFSAPLAVGSESCMGSSSAGGQGVGFGLSVGTTWHDAKCDRRHDAVTLHNLGKHDAAVALLCQDADISAAMESAGTPCPGVSAKLAPASGSQASEAPIGEYPSARQNRR
jgi:hypothetical protein